MAIRIEKKIDIEGLKEVIAEGNVELLPDEKDFVIYLITRYQKDKLMRSKAQKKYYEAHKDKARNRARRYYTKANKELNYKRKLKFVFGEDWQAHYIEGAWENDSGNSGIGTTSNSD